MNTKETNKFYPPRWLNGPPICIATDFAAYESKEQAGLMHGTERPINFECPTVKKAKGLAVK